MLREFLAANTPEIIARTRAKVAARTTPVPSDHPLRNGVPLFMTQLIDRLGLATVDSCPPKGACLPGVHKQKPRLHPTRGRAEALPLTAQLSPSLPWGRSPRRR